MNTHAFLILLVPIIGLCAICRGGRWRWDVISSDGTPILRSYFIHRLLLGLFWLGWGTALFVGLLVLCGLSLTSP